MLGVRKSTRDQEKLRRAINPLPAVVQDDMDIEEQEEEDIDDIADIAYANIQHHHYSRTDKKYREVTTPEAIQNGILLKNYLAYKKGIEGARWLAEDYFRKHQKSYAKELGIWANFLDNTRGTHRGNNPEFEERYRRAVYNMSKQSKKRTLIRDVDDIVREDIHSGRFRSEYLRKSNVDQITDKDHQAYINKKVFEKEIGTLKADPLYKEYKFYKPVIIKDHFLEYDEAKENIIF